MHLPRPRVLAWAYALAGSLALLAGLAGAPPTLAAGHAAGSWAPTAERQGRGGTAVLLTGPACRDASPPSYCGKVLVAGGTSLVTPTELYDPVTGTWSGCPRNEPDCGSTLRPGNLNVPRSDPTMTLLEGPACNGSSSPGYCGKVLLVGGNDPSSELYDPDTGKWTSCASPDRAEPDCPAPYPGEGPLRHHTATLLAGGRVLIAGGQVSDFEDKLFRMMEYRGRQDFYIYDPERGKWGRRGILYNRRENHRAVLLTGGADRCGGHCGKVLIVGGEGNLDGGSQRSAELLDPTTAEPGVSVATPEPTTPRGFGHTATLLPSGDVLVAGGYKECLRSSCTTAQDSTERFDPSSGALGGWYASASLLAERVGHTVTAFPTGKLLIAGGAGTAPELYDPAAGTSMFTGAGPMSAGSATLLPSGPRSACGTRCGKVMVTDQSQFGQLYTPPPEVSDLEPTHGPETGGTPVTLEGRGLASVTSVRFGNVDATSVTPDAASPDTKLVAIAPPQGAGTVSVTATSAGGTSPHTQRTRFTYTVGGVTTSDGGAAAPDGGAPLPGGTRSRDRSAADSRRARRMRGCMGSAMRHIRRERRLARRGSVRQGARRMVHLRRHRTQLRRRCLKRYGRIPGRVTGLTARGLSKTQIQLTFHAPGSKGAAPPAARSYVVKQSTSPIRGKRAFRRAQSLCRGACRFSVTHVGSIITLTITDLRPGTTYYYLVAARDTVSGRLGPRSRIVKAKTQ